MSNSRHAHEVVLAASSQPDPSLLNLDIWLVQGGVAVATILAVAYLIQGLVRLVEACKPED